MFRCQNFLFIFLTLFCSAEVYADIVCSAELNKQVDSGVRLKIIFSNFYVSVAEEGRGKNLLAVYYDDHDSYSYFSKMDSNAVKFQLHEKSHLSGWSLLLDLDVDMLTGKGTLSLKNAKLPTVLSGCAFESHEGFRDQHSSCQDAEFSVTLAVHALKDILKYSGEKMDTYFATHKRLREYYDVFVDAQTNIGESKYVIKVRISDCKIMSIR